MTTELCIRAAFHEAGHATMLYLYGHGHDIGEVAIHRPGSQGHTTFRRSMTAEQIAAAPHAKILAARQVMVDLAGPAAEQLLGYDDWLASARGSDVASATEVASAIGEGEDFIRRCAQSASEIIQEHRAVVDALAQHLLTVGRCSGTEAVEVMRDAMPPAKPPQPKRTQPARNLAVYERGQVRLRPRPLDDQAKRCFQQLLEQLQPSTRAGIVRFLSDMPEAARCYTIRQIMED